MPTFSYTAANNQGEIMHGEMETMDRRTVVDYLSRQELLIVSIKEKSEWTDKFESSLFFDLSMPDKIMITKYLSGIIKAGLSLKEGVDIILSDTKIKPLKKILTEAKLDLEKGQPLSATFKKYPTVFSPVFIAFVRAGELSGTLEKSLEYLGITLSKDYDLSRKIKGALTYPLILVLASIAVIAILMVFVVPKLIKVFAASNAELPWLTKLIIATSAALVAHFYAITITLIIGIALFLNFRKRESVQRFISDIFLAIPVVRDLYKKIILARFTRVFGTLLASGVSILETVDISADAIGYNRYGEIIRGMKSEISRGVSFSNALKSRNRYFPYMLASMVNVGEKTGKLDSILIDMAGFYEEEVDNELKSVVSLIEPILLLVMGLIVAGIAFAIIMPIYQLIGTVR